MSDATATNVLTYLIRTSPSIKSPEFKVALKIMFELLMINWQIPVGGALIASENMKDYIICLTHGIDRIETAAGTSYTWNGASIDDRRMRELTQNEGHVEKNEKKAMDMDQNFEQSFKYFNDIRYIVHRMQKPAFEMPNPVILSTFLSERSQSVSVSAEGSAAYDKDNRHSFYHRFLDYFTEERSSDFTQQSHIMKELIQSMFAMYDAEGNQLWTVNNVVPAATYMQNNATELPSCAYHGNLVISKVKGGQEEIRCVGHLGNSFPGCSTIRQGKGMLNMYERMPLPIHVM